MQQTLRERVMHQLEVTFRSGSTYFVAAVGIVWGLFRTMVPEAQQIAMIESIPILKGWGPTFILIGGFIATRARPSSAVSTQTKAMMEQVARLRLAALLRAKGLPVPDELIAAPVAAPAAPVPVAVDPLQVLAQATPAEFAAMLRASVPVDFDPTRPEADRAPLRKERF